MTVEQRLRIGEDLFRRDAEKIPHALADIGVADVALGGHQPLVDDAGDARGQGGEALVGGVKGLESLVEIDGYSHHRRQQPDDHLVLSLRRVRAGIEKNEHAEQAIALAADGTGEAGAEAGGDGALAQLRRRRRDRQIGDHGRAPAGDRCGPGGGGRFRRDRAHGIEQLARNVRSLDVAQAPAFAIEQRDRAARGGGMLLHQPCNAAQHVRQGRSLCHELKDGALPFEQSAALVGASGRGGASHGRRRSMRGDACVRLPRCHCEFSPCTDRADGRRAVNKVLERTLCSEQILGWRD